MSLEIGSISPEMSALKTRLKTTWEAGDYGVFAKFLEQGALEFFERLEIPEGTKMLDIACGAGQLTVPAAKQGIDVTGVDLAQNLVDQANERAAREGLDITIVQGDAEDLPFEDGEFEVTMSLIGSMFAPRPELVAKEMARVTRSGGRMIMGNWTPEGHVGQMFKLIGQHIPPPSIFPSPLQWGMPDKVRERFAGMTSEIRIEPRMYPFRFPFSPAEVADFFIQYYGPTYMAFRNLDDQKQEAFRRDFADLWVRNNISQDGTTAVQAEYIEVECIRA